MLLSLHERTLYLLHNRARTLTYRQIAKETGLDFHWLRKFGRGVDGMKNPGVNYVERLYTYLSGKNLDL